MFMVRNYTRYRGAGWWWSADLQSKPPARSVPAPARTRKILQNTCTRREAGKPADAGSRQPALSVPAAAPQPTRAPSSQSDAAETCRPPSGRALQKSATHSGLDAARHRNGFGSDLGSTSSGGADGHSAAAGANPAAAAPRPAMLRRSSSHHSMAAVLDEEDKQQAQRKTLRAGYLKRRLSVLRGESSPVAPLTSFRQMEDRAQTALICALTRTAALTVAYMLLAVVVLVPVEGWGAADCAYFAIVTLTTVGYGDLTPATDLGKLVSMVLSVGGLIIVTGSLNNLIEVFVAKRRREGMARSMQRLETTTSLIKASERRASAAQQNGGSGGGSSNRASVGAWLAARWPSLKSALAEGVFGGGVDGASRPPPSGPLEAAWRGTLWALATARPLLVAIVAGACIGFFLEGWALLDSVYYALSAPLCRHRRRRCHRRRRHCRRRHCHRRIPLALPRVPVVPCLVRPPPPPVHRFASPSGCTATHPRSACGASPATAHRSARPRRPSRSGASKRGLHSLCVPHLWLRAVSILTVGYGDFAPTSRLGRTLCTIFLPIACAGSLRSIARLSLMLDFGGAGGKASELAIQSAASNGDEQIARMKAVRGALVTLSRPRPRPSPVPGLSGPCPWISGPCPWISGPCPWISGPCPWISGPCPWISGPCPWLTPAPLPLTAARFIPSRTRLPLSPPPSRPAAVASVGGRRGPHLGGRLPLLHAPRARDRRRRAAWPRA